MSDDLEFWARVRCNEEQRRLGLQPPLWGPAAKVVQWIESPVGRIVGKNCRWLLLWVHESAWFIQQRGFDSGVSGDEVAAQWRAEVAQ